MKCLRDNKKRIISNKAWKSFRQKVRSRKKKRAKRRMLQGIPKEEIKRRNEQAKYKNIRAPKCLSMIENPEGTLEFIGKLERSLYKREKVFVVLKHVDKIASGAIIVLLSIMIKFKKQKVDFNGDHPKNNNARQSLLDSGFFEHLYMQGDKITIRGHKGIFTHANKTVDSDLSDKIISKVSEMIWGEPKRCTGVQRTYLELMQNTNNHASLNGPNEHHWYTTVSYNKEKKKACFSFIDYGVGIIESINRNEKGKFWNSLSKIISLLKPRDNGDFLRMLLDGSIHKTATGNYYRGKGLPGVYKAFRDNKISNLVIITNDAMADCQKNVFRTLTNKFVGTYIYWELNVDNKCLNNKCLNYDNSINSKGL
ncbi:MAG: hypothetical protein J6M59_08910 [Bacteroidaceae bacterium]|nr:hypothetical protein [Bacteroidaceae bacterium]